LSTHPPKLYVNYLLTSELVRAIERVEQKLCTAEVQRNLKRKQVLENVRSDLLRELGGRQLQLRVVEGDRFS
jgi:hypothetical protein